MRGDADEGDPSDGHRIYSRRSAPNLAAEPALCRVIRRRRRTTQEARGVPGFGRAGVPMRANER